MDAIGMQTRKVGTLHMGGISPSDVLRRGARSNAWWLFALGLAIVAAARGTAPVDGLAVAYLDPGAGSFVVQALVATVAGIAVAMRAYWTRIKEFFGRASSKESESPGTTTAHGDDE